MGKKTICSCTVGELRKHLEDQFKPGMTWENYASYWQVDHITPSAFFEDTDIFSVHHWYNLQPLRADENMKKRAYIGGIKIIDHPSYKGRKKKNIKPSIPTQKEEEYVWWDYFPESVEVPAIQASSKIPVVELKTIWSCGEWAEKEAA